VERSRVNLLIPGPTPLPPEVREAMSTAMVDHRGAEFGRILRDVLAGVAQIFQTTSPVLMFAASGTGGLEAAVVNVLSPGDRVLALSCGMFGERFAAVARAFGAEVIVEEAPWGCGIDPQQVTEALRRHARVRAVLVTHNETSTGVTNDLRGIAEAVRGSGALLLVDAVSSLGAIDLRADAWGLDVVVTGSQKALMGPPGGVFISVSPNAWEASKVARMPRHYFSFAMARDQLASEAAYTPFTPAIPVIYALAVSIPMILREGLPARFAHHRRLAEMTRTGVQALGLELFAQATLDERLQRAAQLGGALVMLTFGIGFVQYIVFGLVIAGIGCQRGLATGPGATSVGLSTTSAVVASIVWIVVLDGLFAVLLSRWGL